MQEEFSASLICLKGGHKFFFVKVLAPLLGREEQDSQRGDKLCITELTKLTYLSLVPLIFSGHAPMIYPPSKPKPLSLVKMVCKSLSLTAFLFYFFL